MRAWLVALLLAAVYTLLGARYVPVWISDQALWAYAVTQTPTHPLVVTNHLMSQKGQKP